MNDGLVRREAARPRRVSAAAAAAELGANASLQDGEGTEVHPPRETQTAPDRPGAAGVRMEWRNSATLMVHQRHMPMEPLKFHIPRKTKENRGEMDLNLPAVQHRHDIIPKMFISCLIILFLFVLRLSPFRYCSFKAHQ